MNVLGTCPRISPCTLFMKYVAATLKTFLEKGKKSSISKRRRPETFSSIRKFRPMQRSAGTDDRNNEMTESFNAVRSNFMSPSNGKPQREAGTRWMTLRDRSISYGRFPSSLLAILSIFESLYSTDGFGIALRSQFVF